jgi:S1-C subfamily serine protease
LLQTAPAPAPGAGRRVQENAVTEDTDWAIPPKLQPEPADYRFELDQALRAVVGVKTVVPDDAYTAATLGTERAGSGVVIRPDGLVLTIGYLITEAETIWLIAADGRAVPGHAVAYDQESGFGLVQALGRLDLPALERAGAAPEIGDGVIFAAAGGRAHAIETRVVAREEFAGYWEYLLDEAIFTAPAHPFWGGAALISSDGKLLGIGSLILQRGDGKDRRLDMNMIVPITRLGPIFDDLLTFGRPNHPPRPWLGLYAVQADDAVVVGGVSKDSPAERAGVQTGDHVLALGDAEITDVASLWRRLWETGPAGTRIRLHLARDEEQVTVGLTTADRTTFLRAPRVH